MRSTDKNTVVLDDEGYANLSSEIAECLDELEHTNEQVEYTNNGIALILYVSAQGSAHKEIGTMLSMYEYEELSCFDGYHHLEITDIECYDEDGEEEYTAIVDESILLNHLRQIEYFEKV